MNVGNSDTLIARDAKFHRNVAVFHVHNKNIFNFKNFLWLWIFNLILDPFTLQSFEALTLCFCLYITDFYLHRNSTWSDYMNRSYARNWETKTMF